MPTPRHGIGAASLADRIHVPGGGPQEGFSLSAVHEVYDSSQELVAPPVPALGAAGLLALALALAGAGLLGVRARSSR